MFPGRGRRRAGIADKFEFIRDFGTTRATVLALSLIT